MGSEQKRCLACCCMLLVLAFTLAMYLAGSQQGVAQNMLRLKTSLLLSKDMPATSIELDNKPMPMATTVKAQLAGRVHNISWVSHTDMNTSHQALDGMATIPQHVYVSVNKRDFKVSQSVANCEAINPGYKFHIVDDAVIQSFVVEKAPALLSVFNQLKGVERSDFWRYLVLWSQGGYYIDSDINCMKPFSAWNAAFADQAKAIIGVESITLGSNRNDIGFCCPAQYSNWAMASTPGHPLFEHVIDLILDLHVLAAMDTSSNAAQQMDHVVYKTGPGALSRAVEHYLALFDKYSLDVATEHAELVGDMGVFPQVAFGSAGFGMSSAVYSQMYVKHMFAGSWKDRA